MQIVFLVVQGPHYLLGFGRGHPEAGGPFGAWIVWRLAALLPCVGTSSIGPTSLTGSADPGHHILG